MHRIHVLWSNRLFESTVKNHSPPRRRKMTSNEVRFLSPKGGPVYSCFEPGGNFFIAFDMRLSTFLFRSFMNFLGSRTF